MAALNRRSFVLRITGGIIAGGSAFAAVTGSVKAQSPTRTCLTDRDSTDRPDYGTLTGLTDQDTTDAASRGTLTSRSDADASDREMRGRSWRCESDQYTGVTDTDSGASADRAGYGRGGSGSRGYTDSDPFDPAGNGRGGRGQTGVTDSDSGANADAAGNGRGSRPTTADTSLPQFPWPPPRPSARAELPRARLASVLDEKPTLYEVAEHLLNGLNSASYAEHSFYAVPDGFALVARLERINDDGRPAEEQFRYMPPGDEPFSLSRYVSGLFVAPVGRYRQIVFIVTGQPFVAAGAPLTEGRAGAILRGGANILPAYYRSIEFTEDHQVSALIYEFEKSGQQPMRQSETGSLSALTHLRRSGIYAAVVP